jgi:hypothetical protein
MKLNIGDKVIKNTITWKKNEFDAWGRGKGVGLIVASPFAIDDLDMVDVCWPAGRCFEKTDQLIKVNDDQLN